MFSRKPINPLDVLNSTSIEKALSANQGRALKALIDGITIPTVPDIVDNLTTNDATKTLSAKQGKALKDLIDGQLIFKTGVKTTETANGSAISFDVPFPTNCLLVIPVPNADYDNTYQELVAAKNITASGFEWHGSLVGVGGSNVTGRWLAVGY